MHSGDTLLKLIDSTLAEAYAEWDKPYAQGVIERVTTNIRQVRDAQVFIEVLGVLTSSPIPGEQLLRHYNPHSRRTEMRNFCLPRLGAVELLQELRRENDVKLVLLPKEGLIKELLTRYGLVHAAGSAPIDPSQIISCSGGRNRSETLIVSTQNIHTPHVAGARYLSPESWNPSSDIALHTWDKNNGLEKLSAQMVNHSRLPLAS